MRPCNVIPLWFGPCSLSACQGSCGFGVLDKNQWPFWSAGALSTSNQFFLSGPVQGCGMCFEVSCLERGPVRKALRTLPRSVRNPIKRCNAGQGRLESLTLMIDLELR